MFKKHSHCSFCGQPFMPDQAWPRACAHCGNRSYLNPLPVAVVLVPVDAGLLLVRRSIEPQLGQLALPGGYIGLGETWQQAGAREVHEETGVLLDPDEITTFRVLSAPEGMVLIFGLAHARTAASLPPFIANSEASERVLLAAPTELAFPLHSQAVAEYFRPGRGE